MRDYCQFESFDASCDTDEVILMKSARYGRMRVGRCVARDYGYISCAADVLEEMDRRCSGSRKCHFNIPTLRETYQPCPKDLTAYLEASYSCVKGTFSFTGFEQEYSVSCEATPESPVHRRTQAHTHTCTQITHRPTCIQYTGTHAHTHAHTDTHT